MGGGFELTDSVLLPEDTAPSRKPAWLATRNNAPFALVRGGAAYAFVRPPDPANCEVSQIDLVAYGGTVCATIEVRENQCSPGLSLGANGSILGRAPQRFCGASACAEAFRLWPAVGFASKSRTG